VGSYVFSRGHLPSSHVFSTVFFHKQHGHTFGARPPGHIRPSFRWFRCSGALALRLTPYRAQPPHLICLTPLGYEETALPARSQPPRRAAALPQMARRRSSGTPSRTVNKSRTAADVQKSPPSPPFDGPWVGDFGGAASGTEAPTNARETGRLLDPSRCVPRRHQSVLASYNRGCSQIAGKLEAAIT
jgi:hypothetical protein